MQPVLVDTEAQPTLAVRERVELAGLRAFFDRAFPVLAAAMAAQGLAPAGAPYARYRGRPAGTVDVEVGFPVPGEARADGDVRPERLPAVRAVQAEHVGPYDALAGAYAGVEQWLRDQGLHPGEEMWEQYVTGPESGRPPEEWRTRIVWPVR